MENYKIDSNLKWDYENGFYLTCETGRIGKFLNHLEIYKKLSNIEGEILEFGVYKGTSFVRLISFRDLLESKFSRKVIGFDMFGKFPNKLSLKSDLEFVEKFESEGGYGISQKDLSHFLAKKNTENFELIAGDITKTLPVFIKNNPDIKIAMIHIDVDVYEPTKLILESLWDKVVKGGVVMLDDYETVEGETIAVNEFFADKDVVISKPPFYHIPSYIVK